MRDAVERERFEAWFRLKYLCAPDIESNLEALGRWQAWQARAALAPARCDAARDFPANTCPASRHAQMIGEALMKGEPYPMLTDEPELCGESILSTVASLWEARTKLAAPAVPAGYVLVPVEPTPLPPYYIGGPYIDGSYAMCEVATARVVFKTAAALSAPAVPQWQPIETAPKDGAQVLLSNGTDVSEGRWLHLEGGIHERRDLEGRYIDQDEDEGYDGWIDWSGGMNPEPSHWMPLPAAPSAKEPT